MISKEIEFRRLYITCDFCKERAIVIEIGIHESTDKALKLNSWKIKDKKHCCSTCSGGKNG